jgi:serine/threonine protein phosphatase PrpC
MQYAETGAHKIIYIEPTDDFPSLARAVTGAGQPVVLILPERGGALSGPADFHALKRVRRSADARVHLVMARHPFLQGVARRCGFPVFPSLECIDAAGGQRDEECHSGAREDGPFAPPLCPGGAAPLLLRAGKAAHQGGRYALTPDQDAVFFHLGQCATPADARGRAFGLFAVVDDMGGSDSGGEANLLSIRELAGWILPRLATGVEEGEAALLEEGVRQANRAIWEAKGEREADMGAALAAALVLGATVYVASVGDCRAYLYRPGLRLSQITDDHSPQTESPRADGGGPGQLLAHTLTRQLGAGPSVVVDSFALPGLPGDILLLCSGGLWRVVTPAVIERVLRAYALRPSIACRTLVEAALEAGGPDTISALVVAFQQQTVSSSTARPPVCPADPLLAR